MHQVKQSVLFFLAPRRPVVVSRGDSAPQTASRSGGDSPLDRMSQQVKEVLPHVPLSVIKRDLGKQHDFWAHVQHQDIIKLKIPLCWYVSVLGNMPEAVFAEEILFLSGTTGDIDVTITNLLEGNVAYVPEEPAPVVSSPKPKPALTPQNQVS